jgi:hypothetical protein
MSRASQPPTLQHVTALQGYVTKFLVCKEGVEGT